ncbi:hypothetical protein F5887DRAFT_930437 [Amanita rubescens]|nr:hypothetical protein F5887DRAFT_930437 [Amanita rubescens]
MIQSLVVPGFSPPYRISYPYHNFDLLPSLPDPSEWNLSLNLKAGLEGTTTNAAVSDSANLAPFDIATMPTEGHPYPVIPIAARPTRGTLGSLLGCWQILVVGPSYGPDSLASSHADDGNRTWESRSLLPTQLDWTLKTVKECVPEDPMWLSTLVTSPCSPIVPLLLKLAYNGSPLKFSIEK